MKIYRHIFVVLFVPVCVLTSVTAGCGGPLARPSPAGGAPSALKKVPKVQAEEISTYAKKLLGRKYQFGGTGKEGGFDCSGFVQHVYGHFDIALPRQTGDQFRQGRPVDVKQLQRGDLVFFTTYKAGPSHVGIYLSQGQFIHSPSTGKEIRIDKMTNPYWKPRFVGAKRILP